MKNNVLLKTLLGIATGLYLLMPVFSFSAWLLAFPVMMIGSSLNNSEPPIFFFIAFGLFMFSILATNLLHFLIVPTYIVLLLRNQNAQETIRIILGIGLFFIPFLAAPIYYLVYILPADPPAWALQPATTTDTPKPVGEVLSD